MSTVCASWFVVGTPALLVVGAAVKTDVTMLVVGGVTVV